MLTLKPVFHRAVHTAAIHHDLPFDPSKLVTAMFVRLAHYDESFKRRSSVIYC